MCIRDRAITLMPIMNIGGMQLLKISSGDSSEKILPKSKQISLRLVLIYFSLTLLCAFFYKICGMNFFDSLTHSMTTIATGGFSNYNQSIGFFESAKIEYVSIVFIILGSIPFISYIKFLSGNNYNISDIGTFPWIARHTWHDIGLRNYKNLTRWYNEIAKREAVIKGFAFMDRKELPPKP